MQKFVSRLLLAVLLIGAGTLTAQAAEIKSGAVYCISSSDLLRYQQHEKRGETEFTAQMLAHAQCAIKKRKEYVSYVSKNANLIKVQTPEGFIVWVDAQDFVPDAASTSDSASDSASDKAADKAADKAMTKPAPAKPAKKPASKK